MRYIIFLIFVTVIINVSCNRGSNRDYSLSLKKYREMGIPNPNKVWNLEEIGIAINVFSGIKWSKPYILPRKGSKKSGALFERMISLENMTFLQDDTLQLHDKAYLSLEFLQLFDKWSEVYTNPIWKKQYYHRELAEININEVRLTEIMVELTKDVMASKDPVVMMLQAGVPQIKLNYVSSLVNALNLQSHSSQFLNKDLELIADSLSSSIMRNNEWMDSLSKVKIKKSIDIVLDSTSSDYVKEKYLDITGIL